MPRSIGIYGARFGKKTCCPIIMRNTAFPCEKQIIGKTRRENQTNAKIVLYEGEHELLTQNRILGTMILRGITPSPIGNELIDIAVRIDEKADVTATAVDRTTKNETRLDIIKTEQFSEEKISQMVNAIAKLKIADELEMKKEVTSQLESLREKRVKFDIGDGEDDGICPIYGGRTVNELNDGPIVIDD